MRICSSSHAQFVSACSKPDLGWCHVQLLRGWQTVSAPQHEALWSACQADGQVNDTNESQPSLPLGARHWVTASKQPERVSLNLKVISLTLSFFFFSASHSFYFCLASVTASSLSLSPHLFQKPSLFLSFFLCGYFSCPLKASVFFHCLSSSPLFLPFTLSVTTLCCFLSPCHRLLRNSLTASWFCLS